LSNFFEVLGVVHEDLHAHLHAELVEVKVETGDLGVLDASGHLLASAEGLQNVTFIKLRVHGVATVVLDDVDGLDGVLVPLLNVEDGVHHHLGVEVLFGADDLAAHGGLHTVNEAFATQFTDLKTQVVLNVAAGFATSDLEAAHDAGGMKLVVDQLMCFF
jgi:hypothetical protein